LRFHDGVRGSDGPMDKEYSDGVELYVACITYIIILLITLLLYNIIKGNFSIVNLSCSLWATL
jgi:hypothetical protein